MGVWVLHRESKPRARQVLVKDRAITVTSQAAALSGGGILWGRKGEASPTNQRTKPG